MARTVPVTSSQSPGNFITGALWNAGVKALGDFLLGVPVFQGYQATVQSIPSGTWTALSIDTGVIDSDGGHSNVTNPSRYTNQVAGVYLLLGFSALVANATGVRGTRLSINGSTTVRGSQTNLTTVSSSVFAAPCWGVARLAVGDYVECQTFQNSGGALNTNNGTDATSQMAAFWIAS
jgi:hypothetical protein